MMRSVFYILMRVLLIGGLWLSAFSANAHEVRPAFLSLTENAAGEFSVLWKHPVIDGQRLKVTPVFPPDCKATSPRVSRARNIISERWTLSCGLKRGEVALGGLGGTGIDVFIEINYLDEDTLSAVVKPSSPQLTLGGAKQSAAKQYLSIGIAHILYGWDHLLFVIGLTLLVARRQILGVATAFTLAHSVTLAMVALGGLSLPSRPVEILIAASIILLAVEILQKARGCPSLGARKPYLISFLIGLIHGCGFAGALSEIGLPKDAELLALLLFNVGVEIGQFAIIVVAAAALFLIGKMGVKHLRRAELITSCMIAAVAMFWVIERLAGYAA